MKLRHVWLFGVFLICPFISWAGQDGQADQGDGTDQTRAFQFSLFHPAQVIPDEYSVDGFRFDFIYGVNQDVQGIDLGLINITNGDEHAFQLGLFNRVSKDYVGWQIGMVNDVKDRFNGFQLGVIANVARDEFTGFQASVFFNDTQEEMHGFQLGLINSAGSLDGIQVGLFNFNNDTKYLGFLPLINAAF